MICPKCGFENSEEQMFCKKCNKILNDSIPSNALDNPKEVTGKINPEEVVEKIMKHGPFSLLCFILAILSFAPGFSILTSVPSVILGHMALVLIKKYKKTQPLPREVMTYVGLIIGYVNICLTFVLLLIIVIFIIKTNH